jgi:aminomethyltransferase
MAPFAGFEMPIQYPTGALEEHLATRSSVGLFDIDHMGQIEVSGPEADSFLSMLVSSDILGMAVNDAKYALLLSEAGGVLDDLFIYRLASSWFVVVNASNREADLARFLAYAKKGVAVRDLSEETYMIAVQGPRALELLDQVCSLKIGAMRRFSSGKGSINGIECQFGRTGYTGEEGAEIFFPAESALELWEFLLAEGKRLKIPVSPIGLAARDSLRFEAGMPLHGHEISPEISPLEAGLKWACDFSKDFVGKVALEEKSRAGLTRKLVAIEIQGGVPREGCEILAPDGGSVGRAVAGMFCPTVRKFACNAFVKTEFAKVGERLDVMLREKPREGRIAKRPLYLPAYRR